MTAYDSAKHIARTLKLELRDHHIGYYPLYEQNDTHGKPVIVMTSRGATIFSEYIQQNDDFEEEMGLRQLTQDAQKGYVL